MRQFGTTAFFILLLVTTSGCSKRKATNPNIPAALQESPSTVFSEMKYSSRNQTDLVNDLFDELSEQRPELQAIKDNQMNLIVELEMERNRLFENDARNSQYYNDARAHASSIQDSDYSALVSRQIESSYAAWQKKMESRDQYAEKLSLKRQQLIDELHALKVRLTLPMIEDFQDQTMPGSGSSSSLLQQQASLMKEMKNL